MFHKLATCILLGSLPLASASHLRPRRNLQSPSNLECTILVGASMGIDESFEEEEFFSCEMDPEDMNGISGITLPIVASTSQKEKLKEKLNKGELMSGKSTLKLSFDTGVGNDGVHIPPGLEMAFGERQDRRNLAVVTGEKPILVVKVIDNVGLQRPESSAQISDDIFGTGGDQETLKSQMSACSFGKLNIVPGAIPDGHESAPGTIEVTIDLGLETATDRYQIHNAVTAAVQAKLGFSLPGPYHQVMYVLEKCYVGCGWAAYAYVNSWMSVYQSTYYYMSAVQMHEIGHNFNLAHSGGINGATYTDHTGAMGNPCYADDGCKICFNAAKNWQLGWYDDRKITVDPLQDPPTTYKLAGIADYENNPEALPVVIKVETGTDTDQYIGFNRARGVNINNDEADDEVTITETGNNGAGYSQSFLKAHLVQNELHQISNWAGSGKTLYITATEINKVANPWYAMVEISLGTPCAIDLDCDDGKACNGAETCDLVTGACQAGSPIDCDNGIFCDGVETCVDLDGGGYECPSGPPVVCQDDGDMCNGVPYCDSVLDTCVAGTAVDCSGETSVCGAVKVCEPSSGLCVDGFNFGQDGTCSQGESCTSCPDDCTFTFGSGGSAVCGNGICEEGEAWDNCSQDCNYKDRGQVFFCSGGPDGDCSNQSCNSNGWQCTNEPAPTSTCCGNGVCELGEDSSNCAQDCSGTCGNGSCDDGEDAINCAADCGTCGNGICDNGEDYASCPQDGCTCGDGVCDDGENSDNCQQDCRASCPICSETGEACCGACVTGGKPSDRGCYP